MMRILAAMLIASPALAQDAFSGTLTAVCMRSLPGQWNQTFTRMFMGVGSVSERTNGRQTGRPSTRKCVLTAG